MVVSVGEMPMTPVFATVPIAGVMEHEVAFAVLQYKAAGSPRTIVVAG